MKNLLQTHSVSWAEAVRVALECEAIDAVLFDENSPGYMGFAGRVRVVVLNDRDLPRAIEILHRLEPERAGPPPSWRWQKRGLLCLGLGVVFLVAVPAVTDPDRPRTASTLLFGAAVALLALGLMLVVLGPKADRSVGPESES